MTGLTSQERDCVATAMAAQGAMLEQVEAWAAVNSGSRNLVGLGTVAALIGDALAVLPGEIRLVDPAPVQIGSLPNAGAVTLVSPDSKWAMTSDRTGAAQLVELTHLIASENMRGRFNLALGIGAAGFSEGMVCAVPTTTPRSAPRTGSVATS